MGRGYAPIHGRGRGSVTSTSKIFPEKSVDNILTVLN